MRPKRVNPFSVLLGIVGIAFTLTAFSFCLFVLRGVRPETAKATTQSFEMLMEKWGTTALVVELALLAIATFGSIAVDEMGHREVRGLMRKERDGGDRAGGPSPNAGGEKVSSPLPPSSGEASS
jgi:hypothetical protein